MYSKYLTFLLTSMVLALSTSPALGETKTTSNIIFACENNRGLPVTVAKNQRGKTQTIFNWKPEAFPDLDNTSEICQTVSQKLNKYTAQSKDSLLFAIQPTEQAGLPAICATKTGFSCDLVLLTLAPAEEPIAIAGETLMTILNHEIDEPIKDTTRNLESEMLFPISLFPNEQ